MENGEKWIWRLDGDIPIKDLDLYFEKCEVEYDRLRKEALKGIR